jgi:hypothetical protein
MNVQRWLLAVTDRFDWSMLVDELLAPVLLVLDVELVPPVRLPVVALVLPTAPPAAFVLPMVALLGPPVALVLPTVELLAPLLDVAPPRVLPPLLDVAPPKVLPPLVEVLTPPVAVGSMLFVCVLPVDAPPMALLLLVVSPPITVPVVLPPVVLPPVTLPPVIVPVVVFTGLWEIVGLIIGLMFRSEALDVDEVPLWLLVATVSVAVDGFDVSPTFWVLTEQDDVPAGHWPGGVVCANAGTGNSAIPVSSDASNAGRFIMLVLIIVISNPQWQSWG